MMCLGYFFVRVWGLKGLMGMCIYIYIHTDIHIVI